MDLIYFNCNKNNVYHYESKLWSGWTSVVWKEYLKIFDDKTKKKVFCIKHKYRQLSFKLKLHSNTDYLLKLKLCCKINKLSMLYFTVAKDLYQKVFELKKSFFELNVMRNLSQLYVKKLVIQEILLFLNSINIFKLEQ